MIWSGDPLEVSAAEPVFIDGVRQPLETRQTRLRDRYRHLPRRDLPGVPALTPQMGLTGSALAVRRLHFLLSHPLRGPLVRAMGERRFQGLYSLIAIVTFGLMIYFYGGSARSRWTVGDAGWIAAAF